MDLNQLLLILHFLGLAFGVSATVVNLVLRGLMAGAPPAESRGLARLPPAMAQVGGSGLLLLWATGFMLTFTKWGGFANLPWQFHVKLAVVVALTGAVGMSHALLAKARRGDTGAAALLPKVGTVSFGLSSLRVPIPSATTAGSDPKTLKKLKGAAFTRPSASMVVTHAMGRGTTMWVSRR